MAYFSMPLECITYLDLLRYINVLIINYRYYKEINNREVGCKFVCLFGALLLS